MAKMPCTIALAAHNYKIKTTRVAELTLTAERRKSHGRTYGRLFLLFVAILCPIMAYFFLTLL